MNKPGYPDLIAYCSEQPPSTLKDATAKFNRAIFNYKCIQLDDDFLIQVSNAGLCPRKLR